MHPLYPAVLAAHAAYRDVVRSIPELEAARVAHMTCAPSEIEATQAAFAALRESHPAAREALEAWRTAHAAMRAARDAEQLDEETA